MIYKLEIDQIGGSKYEVITSDIHDLIKFLVTNSEDARIDFRKYTKKWKEEKDVQQTDLS